MVGANQLEKALQVIALDLSDSRCANADDCWVRAIGDIDDGLLHIVEAAQNCSDLALRGRLHGNGLAKMPHKQDKPKGGTALRSVQQRHRTLNSHEGQCRTNGLAHLERVYRALLLTDNHLGHIYPYATWMASSSSIAAVSHGAGLRICSQMGFESALSISRTKATMPSYPA